ncbi:MAG: hypothetical protein ACD_21C00303G0002 [uncultured bacterium]|nr:MAG: hypothetical protein ACD_21C00303G0002 [uncultured bacterium]
MNNLSITPTGVGPIRVGHVGSVMDVIAGNLPKNLDGKVFDAHNYDYGFLLASPKDKYSLGESVIVNNTCYATSTDKNTPNYNKTIHGPKFVTGGIFLIPHKAQPSYRVIFDNKSKPIPLINFYQTIYKSINRPLTFVGLIEFADFHATAIGKPPITGVNIFSNSKEYYPNPPVISKTTHAFIIGVLTDYSRATYGGLNKQLEAVVYRTVHPGDTAVQLTNHAHVITLKQSVTKISDVTPPMADQVLHMLVDGTTVTKASLDVFTIDGVDDYLK